MADFSKTAINQNARREFTAFENISAFNTVVSAFETDTTMGFQSIEKSSLLLKTKVEYFDAKSDSAGYVTIYNGNESQFADFADFLCGNEASETFAGIGGSGSRDSSDDTWTAKFSCVNIVEGKEDVFTVTIGKDYMTITGFTYDATLTKLETWADTQSAMA